MSVLGAGKQNYLPQLQQCHLVILGQIALLLKSSARPQEVML